MSDAHEQLSNCVLIIDELRRVLQCPPEVGLVAHARSIMEKLPYEPVARQLLVDMMNTDLLLYEQILDSPLGVSFSRLSRLAMGKSTGPYQRLTGTEERAGRAAARALEERPALEPHTSSGSESHSRVE